MLWRIPADTHGQRIGAMFNLPTNTPYGHLGAPSRACCGSGRGWNALEAKEKPIRARSKRRTDRSVDVELQPFLVDHALPQRDLCIDERVELLGRAVGRKARHGLEAFLG